MELTPHTAPEFAQALRDLLPPGEVWAWAPGSLGGMLTDLPAAELARVDAAAVATLDAALQAHLPKAISWRLADYKAVADAVATVPHVLVTRPEPLRCQSRVGGRVWSARYRFAIVLQFDPAHVSQATLQQALDGFKQGHTVIIYGVF